MINNSFLTYIFGLLIPAHTIIRFIFNSIHILIVLHDKVFTVEYKENFKNLFSVTDQLARFEIPALLCQELPESHLNVDHLVKDRPQSDLPFFQQSHLTTHEVVGRSGALVHRSAQHAQNNRVG